MITFFVGTPYQLIAALQIRTRLFTNEAADLYLVETNTDLFLYEQALRSVGWFQNVYRTDEPRAIYDRSSTQAQRFLNYFWPRTKIARLLRTKRYERMFSTALGFGNTYYFHYLQKGNPDIRFSYFEEGLGMYTAAVFNCPKMMRVLEQLGFQNVYQHIDGYYLFHPELCTRALPYRMEVIPPLSLDSRIGDVFAQQFQPLPPQCRYLVLDAPFEQQLGVALDFSPLMKLLRKHAPANQIVIKLHPEMKKPSHGFGDELTLYLTNCPWEASLFRLDLSRGVLLSVMSNAVFSPKLLFGQAPTVILLYRLFAEQLLMTPQTAQLFNSITKNDLGIRFYIPESWEELDRVLAKVSEESGHPSVLTEL